MESMVPLYVNLEPQRSQSSPEVEMSYRVLGRTGLRVSEIGFGAWAIGGNEFGNSYGSIDDAESEKAVLKAYECGVNFFDTADVYGFGRSEKILGSALKEVRHNVILATKVGGNFYRQSVRMDFSRSYINFAIAESLKRLETDCIDLYQLHNPSLEMIEEGTIFETMEALKQQGKIRFYGLSIHDPREGIEAIRRRMRDGAAAPDAIQVVFNIVDQAASKELFPLAKDQNIGIIAREPLANGFLTGKYSGESKFEQGDIRHSWPRAMVQARVEAANALKALLARDGRSATQSALKFVLSEPAISVTIPGAKTRTQVEENCQTEECPDLTDHELNELRRVVRRT